LLLNCACSAYTESLIDFNHAGSRQCQKRIAREDEVCFAIMWVD
jgi:hypothetical protein